MKKVKKFIWERRSSFVFTITSIGYGCYHFFKPNILSNSGAYEAVNFVLGLLNGRYFGLLFIIIGSFKLYGIIMDKTQMRLSLYFALLFLWSLLCISFFVSFMQGNDNTIWIIIAGFIGLSTHIVESKPIVISLPKREED